VKTIRNVTTVQLKRSTRDRLTSIGRKNQSYDNLIDEILKHIDMCDRWWDER